jgi:hypothetical protein
MLTVLQLRNSTPEDLGSPKLFPKLLEFCKVVQFQKLSLKPDRNVGTKQLIAENDEV